VTPPLGRRDALAAVATCVAGNVTGCLSGPSFPAADVVVGPEGDLVFEPAELTVPTGRTVTWGFASSGHNVSCRPDHVDGVEIPDGAEPFASYGPDAAPHRSHVPQGETYGHTFDVPGTYTYVCVPHADRGMVGSVTVE
jgi:plastocyanin